MKAIVKKIIIICGASLAFLALPILSPAQQCGVSIYTFTIYVRNGTAAENVRYQIYPVQRLNISSDEQRKYLFDVLLPYIERDPKLFLWRLSVRVAPSYAERFIDAYDPKAYEQPVLKLPHGENTLSGPARDGRIKFFTLETDRTPFLIKISAKDHKTVCILATLFGACMSKM